MLLSRNSIIFLFLAFTALSSCSDKKESAVSAIIDTTVLTRQVGSYNYFYNLYSGSNDISYLKPAGIVADSILSLPFVQLDTISQKKYLSVLFSRAADLNDLKNFIKSRDRFEEYVFLYGELSLSQQDLLYYAQMNLANIYTRYGEHKKASLLLYQSLKFYRQKKNVENTASVILNLSIALKELQQYDEAKGTLLEIFDLSSLSAKKKGRAYTELADIYNRLNKIPEAALQIKRAKQFLIDAPYATDITEPYAILYKIEGNLHMANGDPASALKAYRQSVDSTKASSGQNQRNRELGKIYIAMGKALEQLHFSDSALSYYNRALYTVTTVDTLDNLSLPQQKDIYAENTIAEALYARADCIIARGMDNTTELQNAVQSYKLAFETEKKLLDAFSYDESRLQMLAETRKQTEKAIAVCYRLYERTKEQRWANEAFLFAEHNKAFVLAESVRRNTASSLFLEKDTLYKKIQSLRNNLAVTEIELNQKRFSVSPDTASIKTLSVGKQKAEEELLAAENNIRIKNPQYNDWMTNEVSLPAEEIINKTLFPGTAFIEYFTGDSAVYAFTGAKDQPPAFHKLPANTKKITGDLLHFFSDQNLILNDPVKYAVAANTLYNSILGPYLSQKGSSLLIIPDGFIGYIPFDALLTGPAVSTNISSFPFLIKQQETYYAFSCKTLLAQAQNKNSSTGNSIAAFAPVFAGRERGISPLLHSNEELEAIKQRYPGGKFYMGNGATLKQFEENAVNTGIMHLATHASSGNDSVVAGIEFYDSALYLNRIYTLPLKARLVVLSGCETGSGAINKTEGLMSLARAFSYAGTRNVIGSLWQTEDNTSSEIFKNFYSNLSGNDFSTALYKAKLSVINNSTVASASPYYWSGYIYIGSPGENINQRSSAKLKLIGVLAVLAIITAYFFFRIKRRKT